jgi:hypothetical protein
LPTTNLLDYDEFWKERAGRSVEAKNLAMSPRALTHLLIFARKSDFRG